MNGSSGMGYERKKRQYANPETPIASSSTAHFYRNPQRSATYTQHYHPPRSPSPPASAYFPLLSADGTNQLRPTPNAEQHFAYSTQLRRHQNEAAAALASPAVFAAAVEAEATSLWSRMVSWVTGQKTNEYQVVEDQERTSVPPQEDRRDTPSAHYAHISAQVRSYEWLGLQGMLTEC